MPVRTALRPGVLSPTLPVPKSIPRPEYVGKATAREGSEPWVQTPEVIEKMRVAGRIAAGALAEAGKAVAPGVTTDELDRIAHEYMIDHGAYPSTLGYKGFPKSCCTSLNEIICHGIPDSTVIAGRRHRQHRRHRLHRRRARRHQRHLPGRRRVRGAPAARRAHPRGDDARDQGRQTRPLAVDHRPRHRVVRKPVRLQRGSRFHRPRHRHHLPQRAGGAALRPARRRPPSSSPA